MKVVLFGATGMVGQGCLRDADVESVAAPLLSLLNPVAPAYMTMSE